MAFSKNGCHPSRTSAGILMRKKNGVLSGLFCAACSEIVLKMLVNELEVSLLVQRSKSTKLLINFAKWAFQI
ncbi:hypothetical protein [Pedobacter endophyticus]|uniref:Uncharacterized protein n=1 Tax=Pedobacter endophyticus TaxID=2789740 RepID=A0A7S9PZQ7_9SPHI|nr:hypothetical protein [Pedobacter endophyticus]QPH39951.1 hypothetical protein IZT61_01290 [Pedobacter endophyticus]